MTASPPQRDLGPIDLTSMEKAPHHHSEADNKPRKPRWSVDSILNKQEAKQPPSPSSVEAPSKADEMDKFYTRRANEINVVLLRNEPIVSLLIDGKERLCLAQISNTLLKNFSYNEIHNRRVALGINCVQCTPVQLEILRRHGAMPISSRRCGMITKREAERLVASFLEEHSPPKLPETFSFQVYHTCGWGCKGNFIPSRYNSSRAKCIKCTYCGLILSPNKFIFHFHRTPNSKYHHPDAANFNSWRRHLFLDYESPNDDLSHAWEDVKAMFNGGSRKRSSVDLNLCKTENNKPEALWNPKVDFEHSNDFCSRDPRSKTSAFETCSPIEQKKCSSFPLSLLYTNDFLKGYFNRPHYPYMQHYMNGFQGFPTKPETDLLKRYEPPCPVNPILLQPHKQIFIDSGVIPSNNERFVECFRPEIMFTPASSLRSAQECGNTNYACGNNINNNKLFDYQSDLATNDNNNDFEEGEVEV